MKTLDRKRAIHEPKGEASEEPGPADTLISNFNSRIVFSSAEAAFQSLSPPLTHTLLHLAEGLVVKWLERKQALSKQFNKY